VSSYLRHDRFDIPYDARPGDDRLQDAARPVLDQLSTLRPHKPPRSPPGTLVVGQFTDPEGNLIGVAGTE
jgi:hypothetical protein